MSIELRENAAARLLQQMKPGFIKTRQVRMLVAPFQQDARAIQQILTLLAKAKRGDLAFVVLEILGQEPQQMLDVLNFNVGISTCAQCHLWQKACVLFEEPRFNYCHRSSFSHCFECREGVGCDLFFLFRIRFSLNRFTCEGFSLPWLC